MNRKYIAIALGVIVLLMIVYFKSYPSITGTVVEAETGQPIAGAAVLVEWTLTGGLPGLSNTKSYKVFETVTAVDGTFIIPGVWNPCVNMPDMTIYKQKYVSWNSRIIFPGYGRRTDFHWGNNHYRLDHFKNGYSYVDHTAFIASAIRSTIGNKKIIREAYYWEELEASKERDQKAKQQEKHK